MGKSLSPDRLRTLERRMPPTKHEHITEEEIDDIQDFGKLGWCYIYREMFLTRNEKLENYIAAEANLQKIKKIIMDNEVDRISAEIALANWKK